MTISSTNRKAGPFIGNGSASVFAFSFRVFAASDLEVVRITVATGVETTLTINSAYTVSLNADQNSNPGGSITLTGGALASGYNLIITSNIANLQPTDLTNQGGFYPEVITAALDRATIQIQQLDEHVSRGLAYPITDPANSVDLPSKALRANKYLAFDSNGAPIADTPAEFAGWVNYQTAAAASAASAASSATTATNQAATATANATTATTQASIASTGASVATSAKTAAESARDAAMAGANVYATVAAGLAATTSGQQFMVLVGNEIVRYNNNAGSAVELARYPSVAYVNARTELLGSIDQLAPGTIPVIVDQGSRVAMALDEDGSIILANAYTLQQSYPDNASYYRMDNDLTSLAYAVVDSTEKIGFGITKAGQIIGGGLSSGVIREVSLFGDSIIQQGGVNWWQTTMPGWLGFNLGLGGQQSLQIASRIGAIGDGVTLSGNTMVSGANTITHFNNNAVSPATSGTPEWQPLTAGDGTTRSLRCLIAGVAGLMTRTTASGLGSAETYTFTADAGQALPSVVPPNTPFALEDLSAWDRLCIFWNGRNDNWSTVWADRLIASYEQSVQRLFERGNQRFVILTILNGAYAGEGLGGSRYNQLIELNRRIMERWPHNTFDARRWLITNGIAAIGLTPTAQDLIDIANDQVPESVRIDLVHLKPAVYEPLALAIKSSIIDRFGWYS